MECRSQKQNQKNWKNDVIPKTSRWNCSEISTPFSSCDRATLRNPKTHVTEKKKLEIELFPSSALTVQRIEFCSFVWVSRKDHILTSLAKQHFLLMSVEDWLLHWSLSILRLCIVKKNSSGTEMIKPLKCKTEWRSLKTAEKKVLS